MINDTMQPCPNPWCKHDPEDLFVQDCDQEYYGAFVCDYDLDCNISTGYYVCCSECKMRGPLMRTKDLAKEAWNTALKGE